MRKQLMSALLLGCAFAVPAIPAIAAGKTNGEAKTGQGKVDETDSKPESQQSAAGQLSIEELGTMLRNAGYNVHEKRSKKSNRTNFIVKDSRHGWNFSIQFSISPSGRNIWIVATLFKLPEDFSADEFRALLKSRDTVRSFYVLNNDHLYMYYAFDNHDVTPQRLKMHYDEYWTRLKASEKTWAFPKFRNAKPAVASSK